MKNLAVVAIGGNSLIKDSAHRRVEDQYEAIKETVINLVDIIELGYNILITHGNGAQVGFILRRSEIEQALNNEFKKRHIEQQAVPVVTQVKVDKHDPAFLKPSKPIGAFYSQEEVSELTKSNPNWQLVEDAGRGYRRVVPSPKPIDIVEKNIIRKLVDDGFCVVAVGGGGIPVMETSGGLLEGIDAVIDKDYASALLAREVKADTLIVSTGVDKICLNFGKPDEKPLENISLTETRQYIKEGHFAEGSMLPKITAIVSFLEQGGKKAIISRPENLKQAVIGKAGTCINGDSH